MAWTVTGEAYHPGPSAVAPPRESAYRSPPAALTDAERPGKVPAIMSHARIVAVSLTILALVPFAVTCSPGSSPAEAVDLRGSEKSVFSQGGEDGVIEKIFEVIEPTSKFIVEFGAHDGITASNARNLVLNHGWGALLIEGGPKLAKKLAKAYEAHPKAKTLESWVFPGNTEILFEENGVPEDLDLLVIDIDSNDYYVWRVMHEFMPKVVMIESNIFFPPPQKMVIDFHPMNYWDHTRYAGASLQSLYELGKKKGYELLYCLTVSANCIFVQKQYFDRFGITDNSPEKIFTMWGRVPEGGVKIDPKKRFLRINSFKINKKYVRGR